MLRHGAAAQCLRLGKLSPQRFSSESRSNQFDIDGTESRGIPRVRRRLVRNARTGRQTIEPGRLHGFDVDKNIILGLIVRDNEPVVFDPILKCALRHFNLSYYLIDMPARPDETGNGRATPHGQSAEENFFKRCHVGVDSLGSYADRFQFLTTAVDKPSIILWSIFVVSVRVDECVCDPIDSACARKRNNLSGSCPSIDLLHF
jgi:hypothetical protein